MTRPASALNFASLKALSTVLVFALCYSAGAMAEKADKNKPLNVEADRMQLDDLKQVTVFTGRVVLTKGTILIRADRLVLKQDPEGYQYGTAYGVPRAGQTASFRQKREGVDQFVEGYGYELEYDGRAEVVKLKQNALLRRLEKEKVVDEVCGNLIVYESLSELFTAESGPAGNCNPSGRVKLVIQPRADAEPTKANETAKSADPGKPANSPAAPSTVLRPSDRLNERPAGVGGPAGLVR